MKYCAVLEGVEGMDRPLRLLGQSPVSLEIWAKGVLKNYTDRGKYPHARVVIYETKEVLFQTVLPEYPNKEKQ